MFKNEPRQLKGSYNGVKDSANLPVRQMKHRQRRSSILLGERRATLFGRILAKTLDMLVVVAVYFLGEAIWAPFGLGGAVFICAVQDALTDGQSVGKRIMGLRVNDDRTGQPCGYRASLVRNLPFVVAVTCAAVPLLWVLAALVALPLMCFETYVVVSLESGVRLGDVMANTIVVEYDESRPPAFQQHTVSG